jgi:patatin-like phospholipase/acyl hydrolase
VFFTSPEARKYEHRNYLLRDVARATSAAPTYFEMAAVRSLGGAASYLIDGAMYAGNPSLCAVVEANKSIFGACAHPTVNGLYIVSVGTGKEKKKYGYGKAKDWGAIGWARPLIDILLSASAEVVDYQLQQMFTVAGCRDCYVRLEPELGKAKPDMDDASKENIAQLKDAGECFIKEHAEELEGIVDKLSEPGF